MKKLYSVILLSIIFFALLVPVAGYAQSVGINKDGTTADESAMLDVKNPNKGLLIPRVALTGTGDVATISSPAVSLLIYNTATAGSGGTAVTPGFYYWNGTAWLKLNTAPLLQAAVFPAVRPLDKCFIGTERPG